MKNGTRPTKISHKDYDFIKSHNFGAVVPVFKDEYFADAGLIIPNQEVPDYEFTPPTPALPFGCTDFSQSGLKTDLSKVIHSPNDVEAITHANAKGGLDIRVSLDACTPPNILHPERLGWFKQYFNLRTSGRLDFFDTMRLAQISGISMGESRSITWGVPWFPSWEQAALKGIKLMSMPTDEELKDYSSMGWHNAKLDGWTQMNGTAVYRCFSWQGPQIDPIFFPREVINRVMMIQGTVAYATTNNPVDAPMTIDVSTLQFILSVLRRFIARYV